MQQPSSVAASCIETRLIHCAALEHYADTPWSYFCNSPTRSISASWRCDGVNRETYLPKEHGSLQELGASFDSVSDIPAGMEDDVAKYREALLDAAVELDDGVMEAYLEVHAFSRNAYTEPPNFQSLQCVLDALRSLINSGQSTLSQGSHTRP